MVQVVTVEDLERVEGKIDRLTNVIERLLVASKINDTVKVSDIAEVEGCSESFLRSASGSYLLPNFGKSSYPDTAVTRWTVGEFLSWRGRDRDSRQNASLEVTKRKSV